MLTDGFQIMLAEIFGTAILIILGDGVVAGVLLAKSKAQNAGWIVITTGWALAVAVGVYAIGGLTGAHLNPAVTIGLAMIAPRTRTPGATSRGTWPVSSSARSSVPSSSGSTTCRTGPRPTIRASSSPSSPPDRRSATRRAT